MNYLVGDIGNTSIKISILNDDFSIKRSYNFDTEKLHQKKNIYNFFKKLLKKKLIFYSFIFKCSPYSL